MKTHQKTIVPRNPFAVAARRRKAGAHDKKHKIKRRNARQQLQRDLQQFKNGEDFSPFFIKAGPDSQSVKFTNAPIPPLLDHTDNDPIDRAKQMAR